MRKDITNLQAALDLLRKPFDNKRNQHCLSQTQAHQIADVMEKMERREVRTEEAFRVCLAALRMAHEKWYIRLVCGGRLGACINALEFAVWTDGTEREKERGER